MSANRTRAATSLQQFIFPLAVVGVTLLLVGLPVALWLDLRNLSDQVLRQQAGDLGRAINKVRDFYANDVVARIEAVHGSAVSVTDKYRSVNGGVPIPATFSIELGHLIGSGGGTMRYGFLSDYPFFGRRRHALNNFEKYALATFRKKTTANLEEVSGTIFNRTVQMATPIIMGQTCVDCHNSDPDSPKRDWKIGEVGGIQVITVRQAINSNVFAFKYLLLYMLAVALLGGFFIWMEKRRSNLIKGLNQDLESANDFLAGISTKISKYLSPQIYKSIFSGQKDVTIATERKKLTIFFSDIKDFTVATERMQPEDLTGLLNEYLTEMSNVALVYGGTIDKFIGDAILVFFGDPETKGPEEDAKACLLMAADMQRRLIQLDEQWRRRGIEVPFRARMGINTGYCNVGNFGSSQRMDYTIIGAEANLAARLQSIGDPGKIVLSYETYALVSNLVRARPIEPISMKGISRKVIPYVVDEVTAEDVNRPKVISERIKGLNLFLDLEVLDQSAVEYTRKALKEAMSALDESHGRGDAGQAAEA